MTSNTLFTLEQIKECIRFHDYGTAFELCSHRTEEFEQQEEGMQKIIENKMSQKSQVKEARDQYWQFMSLKAFILAQTDKIDQAFDLLERCINQKPFHSPSLRRLARLHQREGNTQEALKYYYKAELYEPDHPFLIQKIYKLQQGGVKEKPVHKVMSADDKTMVGETSSSIEDKQHVTFGSLEVIEMTSDHSDEYFAHIQSELSKLGKLQPKKSILKTTSTFHKDTQESYPYSEPDEPEQKEEEMLCPVLKKSLSIKSCRPSSPKKWQEQSYGDKSVKKTSQSAKKQKKKKKSVSFGCKDQETEKNDEI